MEINQITDSFLYNLSPTAESKPTKIHWCASITRYFQSLLSEAAFAPMAMEKLPAQPSPIFMENATRSK